MKWQRLTILDLLLLTVAYALAGGSCSGQYGAVASTDYHGGCTLYTMTDVFFQIVVLGNVYACPIILTTQYVFRRRRTWLSEGEWLWLVPVAMLAVLCVWPKDVPAPGLLIVFLAVLSFCSCLSLLFIGSRLCGIWGRATCRWTDVFGSLTCLSIGLLALYDLAAHPPAI
jgi:hypothetical protein